MYAHFSFSRTSLEVPLGVLPFGYNPDSLPGHPPATQAHMIWRFIFTAMLASRIMPSFMNSETMVCFFDTPASQV